MSAETTHMKMKNRDRTISKLLKTAVFSFEKEKNHETTKEMAANE